MRPNSITSNSTYDSAIEINKVLRNTYLLLSLSLFFSAGMAYYAMISNAPPMGAMLLIAGIIGLNLLTVALRNSPWGIAAVFLYTGFMGYSIGPILNFYLHSYTNGSALIMSAFGVTALLFFTLSGYALVSKKNFNYLGGFISIAILTAFILGIGAMVFNWPMVQLAVSGVFALLSSAYILYTTSEIINGGERNYIMATISLYVAIFNLFMSLLRILGAFAGNRN